LAIYRQLAPWGSFIVPIFEIPPHIWLLAKVHGQGHLPRPSPPLPNGPEINLGLSLLSAGRAVPFSPGDGFTSIPELVRRRLQAANIATKPQSDRLTKAAGSHDSEKDACCSWDVCSKSCGDRRLDGLFFFFFFFSSLSGCRIIMPWSQIPTTISMHVARCSAHTSTTRAKGRRTSMQQLRLSPALCESNVFCPWRCGLRQGMLSEASKPRSCHSGPASRLEV
jgi:hypothetical protein